MTNRAAEELKKWEGRLRDHPDVDIYAMGPLSASVCSRLGPEATVQKVNDLMGGLTSWSLSSDATFATGEAHPKPCERTAGRTHYLLE